jgi:SAM-dependent methyltransferase
MRLHSLESERLSASQFMPLWVRQEHLARYQFAARYVKDNVIVDCASGTGQGTDCFLRAGARYVYAFDVSESAVNAARSQYASAPVEFQIGDALHLPLADESADIFISLETIEHIEDDAAFVEEIVRVLKPNGLLICSTPNRALTNPGLGSQNQPFNPFHVREYTPDEFSRMFIDRFSETLLYGQNPTAPGYVKALSRMAKLLPNHGAARINQLMKLPRFLYYNRAFADVVERHPAREYEYLVAVCRNPVKK